jgi:pimeloyl-ACP methyl ester carboxylesterase
METVEVDGLRIAYERAGSGPALVLLHGYVADGPTTWRQQLDDLCDEFTVVAWDAPGTGGSSDPPESFGMSGYADCLAGFVGALRLTTPSVLGLSFGGALALSLHDRHPSIPRNAPAGLRLRRMGRLPTRRGRRGTASTSPRARGPVVG